MCLLSLLLLSTWLTAPCTLCTGKARSGDILYTMMQSSYPRLPTLPLPLDHCCYGDGDCGEAQRIIRWESSNAFHSNVQIHQSLRKYLQTLYLHTYYLRSMSENLKRKSEDGTGFLCLSAVTLLALSTIYFTQSILPRHSTLASWNHLILQQLGPLLSDLFLTSTKEQMKDRNWDGELNVGLTSLSDLHSVFFCTLPCICLLSFLTL